MIRTSRRTLVCLGVAVAAAACVPPSIGRPGPTDRSTVPVVEATDTPQPPPTGPSSRPSFIRPTPTPLPTFLLYTVKSGDTLTSIALAYRTTARSIAFWNRQVHPSLDPDAPDYDPNRIEVGWILLLVPDVELDPEDLPGG